MDFPKSMPDIGLVNGQFVDEDITTGQVGSYIPSSWGNAVTQEILNVIETAELEPAEGENNQLSLAIEQLIADNLAGAATELKSGISKIATQKNMLEGESDTAIVTPLKLVRYLAGVAPLGYFSGLQMANYVAGGDNTISVGPGIAKSSDGRVDIMLESTMVGGLQTTGSWSRGSGSNKLDTGGRVENTWYQLFLIRNSLDGSVDLLFSLSANSPLMPAEYIGFRRVGAVKTDLNGNIIPFINVGRHFWWTTPIKDAAGAMAAATVASLTLTLSVPPGVRVIAKFQAAFSGNATNLYSRSTDAAQIAIKYLGPSNSAAMLAGWGAGLGMNTSDVDFGSVPFEILSDTAGAIVLQYSQSIAGFYAVTSLGYTELS